MAFDAAAAGQWLFEQRSAKAPFSAVPERFGTRDIDAVYGAQDHLVGALIRSGWGPIAGYKIGLTTPRMQAMCGMPHPIAGAVMARRVWRSPITVKAADFGRLGIECEMAMMLAKPLPAGTPTADQVRACLGSICAAFELVDDRGCDYATLDGQSLIADNSWNSAIVLGQPVPVSSFRTLRDMSGELKVNGTSLDRGSSSDVLGDPLNALAWLAGHLARRGRGLEPEQWVLTGSIVATKFAKPGERYDYALGTLPAVSVTVE